MLSREEENRRPRLNRPLCDRLDSTVDFGSFMKIKTRIQPQKIDGIADQKRHRKAEHLYCHPTDKRSKGKPDKC